MPASFETLFFPSRPSRPLEKKTCTILDVDEATGKPRLTTIDLFGSESRNGLLCAGDPVNHTDPSGLFTASFSMPLIRPNEPFSPASPWSSRSNPSWGNGGSNGLGLGGGRNDGSGSGGDRSGGGGFGISTGTGLTTPAPTLDVNPLPPSPSSVFGPSGATLANWFQAVFDSALMTAGWATGLGPETYAYGPNSVEAMMMANAPGVQSAISYYAAKNGAAASWTQQTSVTNFRAGFGPSGAWNAGLNPTQQFTGSYTVTVYPYGPGTIGITTWNNSSFQSLTYGVGPQWNRGSFPTPGGNIYQSISWSQPYP